MRDIRQKFLAHFFLLGPAVKIQLQLIICCFQLGYRVLQLICQGIHAIGKNPDLIVPAALIPGGKIQFLHIPGMFCQSQDRLCILVTDKKHHKNTNDHRHNTGMCQKLVGNLGALLDTLVISTKIDPVIPGHLASEFNIIGFHPLIVYLIYLIIP